MMRFYTSLTKVIICVAVTLTSCTAAPPVQGAVQMQVTDFTAVAKKGIPSVVSIKVQSSPSRKIAGSGQDIEEGDLFDLFGDPFFHRFFGRSPQRQIDRPPQLSQGSGFIVSEDGYILTNQHVVNEAKEIFVTLDDGREFNAKVVGQDPNTDVALLKIDAKDLPFLELGNSDELEIGQWVAAIGSPLGLQATLTSGIVSAKGRNNLNIENIEDFIQTDAPVNRGSSGGPLLDLQGRVVGMATAIVTSSGAGGYMGISFAIPSNMIKHVMDQVVETGSVTRGYLGLTMQAIDKDLAQAFQLSRAEGALVTEIISDSPAEKAGLKQGDVILKLNQAPIKNIASLRNSIAMIKPGTKIALEVLRDNKAIVLEAEVANFPSDKIVTPEAAQEATKYGFSVEGLTPDLAKKYGYQNDTGVVITQVESGSVAAWAGLRAGTLIMAINRQPVKSLEDYNTLIAKTDKNAPVLFLVKQGGNVRFLSLKVD